MVTCHKLARDIASILILNYDFIKQNIHDNKSISHLPSTCTTIYNFLSIPLWCINLMCAFIQKMMLLYMRQNGLKNEFRSSYFDVFFSRMIISFNYCKSIMTKWCSQTGLGSFQSCDNSWSNPSSLPTWYLRHCSTRCIVPIPLALDHTHRNLTQIERETRVISLAAQWVPMRVEARGSSDFQNKKEIFSELVDMILYALFWWVYSLYGSVSPETLLNQLHMILCALFCWVYSLYGSVISKTLWASWHDTPCLSILVGVSILYVEILRLY